MRKFLSVLSVGIAASAFAACSSGGGSSSMGSMSGSKEAANTPVMKGAREIRLSGTSFDFNRKTINLAANEEATIVFTATDAEHDVTVEGAKGVGHIVHAQKGMTARGGLKISAPGTYAFYCSVSGHRKAGMTGQLIVT